MKISLTPTDLQSQPPKRSKALRRLPGEPRPFVSRSSIRNLTPPQHLEGGVVVSSRKHEVSKADPLLQRIKELEAQLRQEAADARATEMALVHACHLIHWRRLTMSGSLEMAEIDAELAALGLEVWTWK